MIESVTLLRPEWLLALVPLTAFAWWALTRSGDLGGWEAAAAPEMLRALQALGQVEDAPDRAPVVAGLVAAFLTILALSGPAVERRDALSFRNLDAVVIVLDASPSVTEASTWPQALTMGRFAIAALETRPGALVVYAGDAYVATDLTHDIRQLGQTFSLIDPDTAPDPGSRPERGLALASRILAEAEILAGDVLLISDGAGIGPEAMALAETIARRGARLSVIALADASPDAQRLAMVGGGAYFTLADTDDLVAFLRQDARTVLERQDYPMLYWRDLGRYVLLLAALPLLILFRRRAS